MSTDQVVCKIAEAVGVKIQEDYIEISHRIKRKEGNKPVLAKFVSHKIKSKVYKARINLKNVSAPDLFPGCFMETGRRLNRIFINENLTPYRRSMMSIALEKRRDGKVEKVWSLDGKCSSKLPQVGAHGNCTLKKI